MAVLAKDDFTMSVLQQSTNPWILVADDQQTIPGEPANFEFNYNGGTGTSQGTGFNIFIYDRDDNGVTGTAASPATNAPFNGKTRTIPPVVNIVPGVPEPGLPPIPTGSVPPNVYHDTVAGRAYWRGTFTVTAPGADEYDLDDEVIVFTGQAQITN